MKTDSGTGEKNVLLKYLFKHLLKKDTLILKKKKLSIYSYIKFFANMCLIYIIIILVPTHLLISTMLMRPGHLTE